MTTATLIRSYSKTTLACVKFDSIEHLFEATAVILAESDETDAIIKIGSDEIEFPGESEALDILIGKAYDGSLGFPDGVKILDGEPAGFMDVEKFTEEEIREIQEVEAMIFAELDEEDA